MLYVGHKKTKQNQQWTVNVTLSKSLKLPVLSVCDSWLISSINDSNRVNEIIALFATSLEKLESSNVSPAIANANLVASAEYWMQQC